MALVSVRVAVGVAMVAGVAACPAGEMAADDGAGTDAASATDGSDSGSGSDGDDDGGSIDDTAGTGGSAVTIDCGAVPLGAVGADFSHYIGASGGTEPYAWLTSGGLPAGLVLDPSDGRIAGTPTESGEFTATIVVTDASGEMATSSCALSINEPLQIDPTVDPSDPSFCITGRGSLLDLIPEGSGDGSPIFCSHQGGGGNGRLPLGIAIDPETCQMTGTLAETRYGTWAFIVRGEQNGAEMFVPYCVTQGQPPFAYTVALEGTGLYGPTGPLVRVFDPEAPLQVGELGDPLFTITDPASCGPTSCFFGFTFGLNGSPFDATTFALPDSSIVYDAADAAIGFSHGIAIGGPAVDEEFAARPWVQNVSLDYCLSTEGDGCDTVDNGDGHLELSILMVPG